METLNEKSLARFKEISDKLSGSLTCKITTDDWYELEVFSNGKITTKIPQNENVTEFLNRLHILLKHIHDITTIELTLLLERIEELEIDKKLLEKDKKFYYDIGLTALNKLEKQVPATTNNLKKKMFIAGMNFQRQKG